MTLSGASTLTHCSLGCIENGEHRGVPASSVHSSPEQFAGAAFWDSTPPTAHRVSSLGQLTGAALHHITHHGRKQGQHSAAVQERE
eukprot:1102243-Pelagomonas_calceolata.AAC.3